MTVTSRRAVAAGAWAAVLLALAVTGPQWAFTPWFAAASLLLLAGLAAYALGLLDPHHAAADGFKRGIRTTRREREGRVSDSEKAAQEAWDAILADYRPLAIAPPVEHSANWETRTDVIDSSALDWHGLNGDVHVARDIPAFTPDLGRDAPAGCPEPLPSLPQVTVTDDPPGRHARPRVHPFTPGKALRPYCAAAGCTARNAHWTEEHPRPDPLVDELLKARADREEAERQNSAPVPGMLHPAIIASLEEAGFTGHATSAALYESAWTKGMARAIADVEAARR